jgi:hypothetical protein
MSEKKEQKEFEKIRTAVGVTKYCWLNEPRLKFQSKTETEYQCTLILPPDAKARLTQVDGAAQEVDLFPYLDRVADEAFNSGKAAALESCKTPKAKKEFVHTRSVCYDEEVNDDSEPTGNYELRAKRASTRKNKKGEAEPVKLDFFDAAGTKLTNPPTVFSGSEVKLSLLVNPFENVAGKSGVGVRILAVQIIKLKSGGSRSASDYGFDGEEGYTAPAGAAAGEEEF